MSVTKSHNGQGYFLTQSRKEFLGSLGFAVLKASFGGVRGVFTPRTPPKLAASTSIPKEPIFMTFAALFLGVFALKSCADLTVIPLCLCRQFFKIQHLDHPPRGVDDPLFAKLLQHPADDFPRAAQFGGDFLMGDADRVL